MTPLCRAGRASGARWPRFVRPPLGLSSPRDLAAAAAASFAPTPCGRALAPVPFRQGSKGALEPCDMATRRAVAEKLGRLMRPPLGSQSHRDLA